MADKIVKLDDFRKDSDLQKTREVQEIEQDIADAVAALRALARDRALNHELMLGTARGLTKRERTALVSNTGAALIVRAAFELCLESVRSSNRGRNKLSKLEAREMTADLLLRIAAVHGAERLNEVKDTAEGSTRTAAGLLDNLGLRMMQEFELRD